MNFFRKYKKYFKNKNWFIPISVLGLFLAVVFYAQANITNIIIDPTLNITNFSPYKIKADISNNPTSVSVQIEGINGDNPSPSCWDYYVDGTCGSDPVNRSMSYNPVSGKWESSNIYPDDIYPEIYFASSDITWYNQPLEMSMWRRNYHLLKFTNPFSMVDGMSFFIELNAVPVNTGNSGDLQVYIVEKDVPLSYFNEDWRNKSKTELVATFNRNNTFHHQHTGNSQHHLVSLSTNSNGRVGSKNLDLSENFWIVLYQDSVNTNRGWNLRYHPSNICDNTANWYVVDRSGGNTWNPPVYQSGCPDAHIHIARRLTDINTTTQDGLRATVTANFSSGGPTTQFQDFYFAPVPNLPPNPTSFINPIVGGVYSENINVSWNPATDPNNDPLIFNIYLLDENDQVIGSPLVAGTSTTSFLLDISNINNGNYSLKGVVVENIGDNPLSTEFYLGGTFSINKAEPIYSLSNITISSNNSSSTLARTGDIISLEFDSSGAINPSIVFHSGGDLINNSVNISSSSNNFTITYQVSANDSDGYVSFEISASNLDKIYDETTNGSVVLVDTTAPLGVIASPSTGTYNSSQNISLSSSGSDYIRYTDNGADPSCSIGSIYSVPINISSPKTIKAIACDLAGNNSGVSTFVYSFSYTLNFYGNGGTGHSPITKNVEYGATTTLPTNPTRTGYTFAGWNTEVGGAGDTFSESTVVESNLNLYAQWNINSYDLVYNGNGNTSGTAPATTTFNYNSTTTVENQGDLAKTGYTFYGWNTESDGGGTAYQSGDTMTILSDTTLYAQWLENDKCTVTFNGNGGSGYIPGFLTVDCGDSLSSSTPAKELPSNPSRTGYTFNNWNTLANGSGDIFTTTTTIATNTTVYAQWTANTYTLSFNAQGGAVDPSSKSVTYNSAVGVLPTPTKTNYTFTSWNTEEDGSGSSYTSETIYISASSSTLYAQWTANTYTLSFNAQGGTVSTTSKSVTYNSAVGVLPTPTKTNYTFTSWNTMSDGNGLEYNNATVYNISGNSTLYAQWVGNTYIIAFNSQGGSLSPNKAVVYSSALGALPTPTREGYIFSGWFTDTNGQGTQYASTTIYNISGNSLLFAYWSPIVVDPPEDENPENNISGSNSIVQPGSTGQGIVDVSIGMHQSGSINEITSRGVNYLSYINSTLNFKQTLSSSNQAKDSFIKIVFLDLFKNIVELNINNKKNISLKLGEFKNIDLDDDGLYDLSIKFHDLFVNRVELTVKSFENKKGPSLDNNFTSDLDLKKIIDEEKKLISNIDRNLANKLSGRILLQVEKDGQSWYLDPLSKNRYFMGRPTDAFSLMRRFGLGVSNNDFSKFEKDGAPRKLAGRIILTVEKNGEAYYINPVDMKMYYLGRPVDAFNIMRNLSLGIKNQDIYKINVDY